MPRRFAALQMTSILSPPTFFKPPECRSSKLLHPKCPPDLSWKDHRLQKTAGIDVYPGPSASLKDSPMYILRALVFLFLTQAVFAQQPTPILPDPKLTPGDTFDVTAQDVCVPGYAKKVRAVPAWLKRQA